MTTAATSCVPRASLWRAKAVALLVVSLLTLTASSQTDPITPQDAELIRRENQLLREEIRAADRHIELLMERIVLLERQLGYQPLRMAEGRETTDEVELILPDDALASPATILRELSGRYAERFEADDQSLGEGSEDAIAKWCREMSAQLRGKRDWIVSIDSVAREGRKLHTALFVVYDGETRRAISEPFRTSIPERFATRVMAHKKPTLWRINGLVIAEPKFTRDRLDPGVFNYPPLVGPFVEFDWRFVWYGLSPHEFQDPETVTPETPVDVPGDSDDNAENPVTFPDRPAPSGDGGAGV